MANYEATKYDFDGANITGLVGISTGSVIPWSDGSVPSGFLECNGAAVSRSTYAALFAVIGTTYGSGNGSTTFNVPDLQNDNAMGKSPNKALASTGGADTVTATGNFSVSVGNTTLSTPTIASHSHSVNFRNKSGGGLTPPGDDNNRPTSQPANKTSGNTGGGGAHNHPGSATFSGNATSVVQPYVALLYIIKT